MYDEIKSGKEMSVEHVMRSTPGVEWWERTSAVAVRYLLAENNVVQRLIHYAAIRLKDYRCNAIKFQLV